MPRTRRQQVRDEKGPYVDYFTAGQAAKALGIQPQRWERWIRAGKIPQHNVRTDNGWRLWSPVVIREAIDRRARGEL